MYHVLKWLVLVVFACLSLDITIRAEECTLPVNIKKFYESGVEKERLKKGTGRLEKLRTEKLLERFLPQPPAIILDVGCGTGVYAFDLVKWGYGVYLIDPVPYHIEEAKKIGETLAGNAPLGYIVGDARKIEMGDQSADVVLFFGPLYHLNPADRRVALSEAHRVLKHGGILFAVAVSRYAPTASYFKKQKMTCDLETSIFSSLTNGQFEYRGALFYSHYPQELRSELEQAGFNGVSLYPVEGLGSLATKDTIEDETVFQEVMRIIKATEQDESVLGMSSHIMAIGKK